MRDEIISLMNELKDKLDLEMKALSEKEQIEVLSSWHLAALGQALNEKRKQLQLDIQSLEWQTGLSNSTIKRILKDPSQVKFTSVVMVAEALGVKLCFVK